MAAETDLVIDDTGLASILTMPGVAGVVHARAEAGRLWLTAEAAVVARRTGVYAGSFEVQERTEWVSKAFRKVAYVVNTDPKAWAVEWGRGAHFLMTRAESVMKRM